MTLWPQINTKDTGHSSWANQVQDALGSGYPAQNASYVIFKEGSTFYARNGSTGKLDYSGSNAATVIQAAIDASGTYGCIYCKGSMDLSAKLTIDVATHQFLSLIFENFECTMNDNVILIDGGVTSKNWFGRLIGGGIQTSHATYSSAAIKLVNVAYGTVKIGRLQPTVPVVPNSVGVHILGDAAGCLFNTIQVTALAGYETGYLIESTPSGFANANTFYDTVMYDVVTGTKMINNGINTSGNHFFNIQIEGTSNTLYGFYNQDEANIYYGCATIDMPVGTLADFYTNALTGNNRPRLYGCQASKSLISGSFIHFATTLYITENSGTSSGTGSEQTIAHGLSATPNRVYLTPSASGITVINENKAADATNIYPIVTSGKAYYWKAEKV